MLRLPRLIGTYINYINMSLHKLYIIACSESSASVATKSE